MERYLKNLNAEDIKSIKRHNLNRATNKHHVNEIKKALVQPNGLDRIDPIKVNMNTNTLLDGEHRRKAFLDCIKDGSLPKIARLSVIYMDIPEKEEQEYIIALNNTQRRWLGVDFATSYMNGGNDNYIKLMEFCKTHSLCHKPNGEPKLTYAYMLINGSNGHGANAKSVRDGSVKITDDMIANADRIHNEIMDFKSAFESIGMHIGNSGEKIRDIISVYSRNEWKHPINVWTKGITKLGRKEKNEILQMPNITVKNWEDIVNQIHLYIIDKRIK